MIIPWIIAIVLALQCIGFVIAKKKLKDTHGILNYLVRYNIMAGASAFYLIALLWVATGLPNLITTSPVLYYMISASLFLTGIALPYKMYSHVMNRKDGAK